jgi:hypothetical protein
VTYHLISHNGIQETSLKLTYLNDTANKLEAVLELPNNPDWVIGSLKVTVGDKVIQAEVKDKQRARERYSDAIARGD